MEEAAQRMRAVRDYARAFLGCQRRPGHEGHERELMQRTNDIYGERFEDLVADYPFLDLPMVDLSGGGH